MNRTLQEAINEWESEVAMEAARLIRSGTPPVQAQGEAIITIQRRRSAKAIALETTQHPLNQSKDSHD